jgi:ABC-type Fe3+-hydroxamate transport system substrate-binding protein
VPVTSLARHRLRAAALLITPALVWAGCGEPRAAANAAIEVVDDAGETVRLASPAQRVVSLVPARTDLILALGAAHRIVARTQFDEDPRISDVPSVGDALTPSIEWLMAQRPDLVVAWPDQQSRTVVTRLRDLGVPVYASRVQSLADVDRSLGHLGALLGLEEAADSLRAAIRSDFEAATRLSTNGDRPSVVYLIGLDPAVVAGPGTYIDELLEIAGARNAFADAGALWPTIGLEEIVRRQPDYVLVALGETDAGALAGRLATRPGWRAVAAVRDGRVHLLDPALFNRPGARVGEAALRLAQLLHPEGQPP